jgi:hypothetical protein
MAQQPPVGQGTLIIEGSQSHTIWLLYGIYSYTWWRSWLRYCATSRKVAGSISDGVIGIFHWLNPSNRTMALGSFQSPIEMRTRNISWGVNAAGAYGWQLHVPIVSKSWSLNLLEPSGPVQACNGTALPLPYGIYTNLSVTFVRFRSPDRVLFRSSVLFPSSGEQDTKCVLWFQSSYTDGHRGVDCELLLKMLLYAGIWQDVRS